MGKIKENYNLYRQGFRPNEKRNWFFAFIKAVRDYIFGTKPTILSESQRREYESGLSPEIKSKYDVLYAPGAIKLVPKPRNSKESGLETSVA